MSLHIFPSSIESIESQSINKANQPFIHIMLFDWQVSQKSNQTPTTISTMLEQYFLSIPETTIQEQYNHQWDSTLDTAQFMKAGVAHGLKGLIKKGAGMIGLGDSVSAYQKTQGQLINDFVSQNYSGVDFRRFEFLFNMIPKSLKEAETIKNIITTLKIRTTPVYDQVNVKFPVVAKFAIYSGGNSNNQYPLFKSMFCGIENLGFNYSPSGFMRTFKDGNPVQVHMNITFRELKRIDNAELLGNN